MIIGTSKPCDGRVHDMRALRESFPDFDAWLESMKNPNTPISEMIMIYSDTGFLGIKEVFPGIISVQPKKSLETASLTKNNRSRTDGSDENGPRVNTPSHIKNYAALEGVFRGTEEQLYTTICNAVGNRQPAHNVP